jgi:hypothetical protein
MRLVVTMSNLAMEELPAAIKLRGVTGGNIAVCTVMIPSVLDNELSDAATTEAGLLISVVSFLQAVNKKNAAVSCNEICVIFMILIFKVEGRELI